MRKQESLKDTSKITNDKLLITNQAKRLVLFVLLFWFLLAAPAQAVEVGLSPTSPFYFIKEWRRGLSRLFTFGALNNAILDVKFLNERAAEIKVLQHKNEPAAIRKALQNYDHNLDHFQKMIRDVHNKSSESAKINLLLDMLTETLLNHATFFGDLKAIEDLKKDAEETTDKLEEVAGEMFVKFDEPAQFKNRFKNAVYKKSEGIFKDLGALYVLSRLENKLSQQFEEEILELKDDLTFKFEGFFRARPAEVLSYLNSFSIERAEDLMIFDEIREKITDSDLKSQLNFIRQNALKNMEGSRFTEEKEVTEVIKLAEDALKELKERILSGKYLVSRGVSELLERADFHLEQAKNLYQEGQYGAAFGQATVANAEAKNGLSQLVRSDDEIEKDNFSLRVQFDDLAAKAREKNLTRETSPKLYELFDRAEKAVLQADTVAEVRDAKIILAEIEILINNGE